MTSQRKRGSYSRVTLRARAYTFSLDSRHLSTAHTHRSRPHTSGIITKIFFQIFWFTHSAQNEKNSIGSTRPAHNEGRNDAWLATKPGNHVCRLTVLTRLQHWIACARSNADDNLKRRFEKQNRCDIQRKLIQWMAMTDSRSN